MHVASGTVREIPSVVHFEDVVADAGNFALVIHLMQQNQICLLQIMLYHCHNKVCYFWLKIFSHCLFLRFFPLFQPLTFEPFIFIKLQLIFKLLNDEVNNNNE
jgi:hypothetical protein